MKDKLNNLLSIEEFSDKKVFKQSKPTKRTEVAKDVIEEKVESSQYNKYHNLISLDEFSEKDFMKTTKQTKRTEVGKDVLNEKKKKKEDCDDEEEKDDKKDSKKEEPKKGLTPGQKKLPLALQKAILKRQGKK
jgi:hypothetical protein